MTPLKSLQIELTLIGGVFDLELKESTVQRLEHEMQSPDFWKDTNVAKRQQKELSVAKREIKEFNKLEDMISDI